MKSKSIIDEMNFKDVKLKDVVNLYSKYDGIIDENEIYLFEDIEDIEGILDVCDYLDLLMNYIESMDCNYDNNDIYKAEYERAFNGLNIDFAILYENLKFLKTIIKLKDFVERTKDKVYGYNMGNCDDLEESIDK